MEDAVPNLRTSSKPVSAAAMQNVCIVETKSTSYREHMEEATFLLKRAGINVDKVKFDDPERFFKNNFSDYCSVIVPDIEVAKIISERKPELHIICIGDIHPYSFRGDIITYNYYSAGYQAVRYLINLGYKRIACYNIQASGKHQKRQHLEPGNIEDGYRDAIQDGKQDFCEIFRYSPGTDPGKVLELMLNCDSHTRPDAIVCTFDHRAFEVYEYAQSLGLRVPQDLALISLGSSDYAEQHKFSSVDFCPDAIAPLCVEIINEIIDKKRYKRAKAHYLIDTELIIRDSCGYKLKRNL